MWEDRPSRPLLGKVGTTTCLARIRQYLLKPQRHKPLVPAFPLWEIEPSAMKAPNCNIMWYKATEWVLCAWPTNWKQPVSRYRTDWMCDGPLLTASSSPSVPFFLANRNSVSFRYSFSRKGDLQAQPQGKTHNSPKWKRFEIYGSTLVPPLPSPMSCVSSKISADLNDYRFWKCQLLCIYVKQAHSHTCSSTPDADHQILTKPMDHWAPSSLESSKPALYILNKKC